MHGQLKKLARLSAIGLLTALSSTAFAAGYKMEFQSTSVLADAGDAAVVEDAGTNWFNSAGLVYVPHQLVGSIVDIWNRTQFTGSLFAPSATFPATPNFFAQGNADSYLNRPLPAIHYSLPIKDRFAFGISIVPAWGLSENYGVSSFTRYDNISIYTKTIDIAPSLAWKITDKWSVGAGPDFNYLTIQEKFAANLGSPFIPDALSRVSADDWNTGWHAGALLRLNDCTRFGLNYRSKIVMHLTGSSALMGAGLPLPTTNSLTFHWVLPPTTSFSAYRDLNPCWAIMGTLAYDQWSALRGYNVQNFMSAGGPVPVYLAQGFRDTVDMSVGTHYKWTDKIMLRGSLKYEPTPTGDQHRDINFPDSDKLGVNLGGRYTINKKLALDMLYAHVFTRPAAQRATPVVNAATGAPLTGVVINGHTTTAIDIFGAQLVWNI